MASSGAGATERTGAYRRLVDCLPFPAALLDAAQDWRVVLANDAFARAVAAGTSPHGRSLRDVLPPHGGWPEVAELLEDVRRGARPSEGATVVVEQARSGFDGPGTRWTMELQPLTDAPGTVWGALAWLRGGEDMPASDAEPPPGDGLRNLAAGLVADRSVQE
ncbi:MAG: PAS domain-containing protein, partial [Actinomycetota bacterium]|nr:PAS domain-containing protein [Actinomycetota bacterium]